MECSALAGITASIKNAPGKIYMSNPPQTTLNLKVYETPAEMESIEEIQRLIWPGSEFDVIPSHMLLASVHSGGLVIGAVDEQLTPPQTIGFVFSFPGFYYTPDGPRAKHCSHQLGVLPAYRNTGVGFRLKRAQWQLIRNQGIDRITWTFDPLMSLNAHLNITKLGTVCNTYLQNFYGDMRDDMNKGLPSDRFEVDWWVNSPRVEKRLSKFTRPQMQLNDYQKAEAVIIPSLTPLSNYSIKSNPLVLIEIPVDFQELKSKDLSQALEWRLFSRMVFEELFSKGFIITDFVHDTMDGIEHSFYTLCHGEATL